MQSSQAEVVPQTLVMLEEMSRCAVLWEEQWHSALAEAQVIRFVATSRFRSCLSDPLPPHQVDAARRWSKLQAEFKRVVENAALEELDKARDPPPPRALLGCLRLVALRPRAPRTSVTCLLARPQSPQSSRTSTMRSCSRCCGC